MRISDCSSDVCSSDLQDSAVAGLSPAEAPPPGSEAAPAAEAEGAALQPDAPSPDTPLPDAIPAPVEEPADRKCVLSGKSVSVCVLLGGRCNVSQPNQSRMLQTQYTQNYSLP